MTKSISSTVVQATIRDLKETVLSLGDVDVVSLVQGPGKLGKGTITNMTVIYKEKGGYKKDVNFEEALEVLRKTTAPKDINLIMGAGKKVSELMTDLTMSLLIEALKIKKESPTNAVRLVFGDDEIKNTQEAASRVIKLLKGVPEEKIPLEIKSLLEWSRKFRPGT